MKKILVISTGGTISQQHTSGGRIELIPKEVRYIKNAL